MSERCRFSSPLSRDLPLPAASEGRPARTPRPNCSADADLTPTDNDRSSGNDENLHFVPTPTDPDIHFYPSTDPRIRAIMTAYDFDIKQIKSALKLQRVL
jgi:hypothetical protein